MRSRILTVVALAAALLIAGEARAQAQQPNPLDVVPDVMPFDIPYGPPIALDRAKAVIAAAEAEALKRNWKMNIAVLDSGGNLVAFERMDGALLASVAVAQHKARVAVIYRRESKAFENAVQLSNFHYILSLDEIIAARGGIPLVENGKLIGAIGCSGGAGSQDEVVAKVGAGVIK